jgi:hypothetical protein
MKQLSASPEAAAAFLGMTTDQTRAWMSQRQINRIAAMRPKAENTRRMTAPTMGNSNAQPS